MYLEALDYLELNMKKGKYRKLVVTTAANNDAVIFCCSNKSLEKYIFHQSQYIDDPFVEMVHPITIADTKGSRLINFGGKQKLHA